MLTVAYFNVSRLVTTGRVERVSITISIRPSPLNTVMPMVIFIVVMLVIGRMVMTIADMKMRLRVVRIRSTNSIFCMRMRYWMPQQKQEDQQ